MSFYDLFQMMASNVTLYLGAFIVVLSILVFVHEMGHYLAARLCGVKVEVFSIGFGKELFGFYDRVGTRWKVCLVPLGGYVKLFGDVDPASAKHDDTQKDAQTGQVRPMTEAERSVAFFSKSVGKRAFIVAAGPGINYVFAIILLAGIFIFNGQPVTPPSGAAVILGSSADTAGFLPHDKVVSIDGRTIDNFDDIRREMMIALDQKRHFVVDRDGQTIDIYASPTRKTMTDRFGFEHSIGLLGLISPRHAVDIASIQKINDVAYTDPDRIREAVLSRMGQSFKIEIKRGEEIDVLLVKPKAEYNKDISLADSEKFNVLYLADGENNIFIKHAPVAAVGEAFKQAWVITVGTVQALGQIITGTRSATELGGVIRIGALAGDMAQQGLIAFILFTALLSINLGLVNLFPIPLLDGGHLVFYTVEALIGRPIPDQIQEYAFRFGLVFLVGIMVFANLNDIMQLIL
jgi:regulator of sigma E protease